MSVMLCPCIFLCFSVYISVCLVCCVLDSVCELFGETIRNVFGCGAVLLLNVMDVFSVGGGALLDRLCMVFHKMCVLCLSSQCASKCSFHMFCLCFCMSEGISSFKSLRAGSQEFTLLMLFLWVILHIMWSGKSLQLLCILPFGMLCLSDISMMFVKILLAVCMLVGMVV